MTAIDKISFFSVCGSFLIFLGLVCVYIKLYFYLPLCMCINMCVTQKASETLACFTADGSALLVFSASEFSKLFPKSVHDT